MQTKVAKNAIREGAVSIHEFDGRRVSPLPYIFPLPQWEGVEEVYNVRDFALCEALHFMGVNWE